MVGARARPSVVVDHTTPHHSTNKTPRTYLLRDGEELEAEVLQVLEVHLVAPRVPRAALEQHLHLELEEVEDQLLVCL